MSFKQNLEGDGFLILESVFEAQELGLIRDEIKALSPDERTSVRKGTIFGARNLFQTLPSLRSLVNLETILGSVRQSIGNNARPVRCLFFDKTSTANWSVAWHQDMTIAVRQKREVSGFESRTRKAGVCHVQPPVPILERMVAVRIHLDSADESNGALRVIPGSHQQWRLTQPEIEQLISVNTPRTCSVPAGGVVFIKPLLLHSSLSCKSPLHRRVLHVEFSGDKLPGGLEWYEG